MRAAERAHSRQRSAAYHGKRFAEILKRNIFMFGFDWFKTEFKEG